MREKIPIDVFEGLSYQVKQVGLAITIFVKNSIQIIILQSEQICLNDTS